MSYLRSSYKILLKIKGSKTNYSFPTHVSCLILLLLNLAKYS